MIDSQLPRVCSHELIKPSLPRQEKSIGISFISLSCSVESYKNVKESQVNVSSSTSYSVLRRVKPTQPIVKCLMAINGQVNSLDYSATSIIRTRWDQAKTFG